MKLPRTLAPEWEAAMASPWVSVNKALRIHDVFMVKAIVQSRTETAPPGGESDGDAYLVADSATGDWYGEDGRLAIAVGAGASNGWHFCNIGLTGAELYVVDEAVFIEFDGAAWVLRADQVQNLGDLDDVDLTALQDGDSIVWSLSEGLWVPGAGGGGGGGGSDVLRMLVKHTETDGTPGGALTSGSWATRVLNTEEYNSIPFASLSANQVTLTAGTYRILARTPFYRTAQSQSRLFNVTAGATAVLGSCAFTDTSVDGDQTYSIIDTVLTLAVTSALRVESRVTTTNGTNGGGVNASFGVGEVYSQMMIEKID